MSFLCVLVFIGVVIVVVLVVVIMFVEIFIGSKEWLCEMYCGLMLLCVDDLGGYVILSLEDIVGLLDFDWFIILEFG